MGRRDPRVDGSEMRLYVTLSSSGPFPGPAAFERTERVGCPWLRKYLSWR